MNESLSRLKIIAAGGGSPSTSSLQAMKAALDLAVPNPNVLIIPSAKRTREAFEATVPKTEAFFHSLGLTATLLHDFGEPIEPDKANYLVNTADLIYTAGGDTLHMMDELRRHAIDQALASRALAGEVVLSGISAGAILPTTWGHSDSLSYRPDTAETWEYIRADGLGIAPIAVTPHFNNSHERLGTRRNQFSTMLLNEPLIPAFGIDNLAAIRIADGRISQVQSNPNQFVYAAELNNGTIDFHALSNEDSLDLTDLAS